MRKPIGPQQQWTRTHGGIRQWERTHLDHQGDIVDLSVSINPYGPPTRVHEAITAASITEYPDPHCWRARQSLSSWLGLAPEQLVLGSGAADLLWSLARSLFKQGDGCVTWEPCFDEFRCAAHASGAIVMQHPWSSTDDYTAGLDGLAQRIEEHHPKCVYLCAPSSPFGRYVPVASLRELAERFDRTWFVWDQSFLAMSQHASELRAPYPSNVIAVRSLTKELGIPGVRIGYAVLQAPLRERVEAQRPHWSVSAAALAAATEHAACITETASNCERLLDLAAELQAGLKRLGVASHPSDTHYLVVDLPPTDARTAGQLATLLLSQHKILVRDCASFGFPRSFRVAAHPLQGRLLEALPKVLM